MIRKSVQRFSEKIMLNQESRARWRFILTTSRSSETSRTLLEVAKPDRWADDVAPSDIEPLFLCSACGKRGSGRFQLEPKSGGGDRLSVNDKPRRRFYLGDAIDLPAFDCYRGPAPSAIWET
jgi:hypothetical protein